MMNWFFDIPGTALLVLILVLFVTKRDHQVSEATPFYLATTLLALASTLLDIFCALWSSYPFTYSSRYPIWVSALANYLYFITHNLTFTFLFLAIVAACRIRLTPSLCVWQAGTPILLICLLLLANPLTGWVFTIDQGSGIYSRGPFSIVTYLIASSYLIGIFGLISTHKRRLTPRKTRIVFGVLLLIIVGALTQFFLPLLLIENYAEDLAFLIVFVTLNRPEEVKDWSSGLFNSHAFQHRTEDNQDEGQPFSLVLVTIKDFTLLRDATGVTQFDHLIRMIARELEGYTHNAYRLDDDVFCLWFPSHKAMVESGVVTGLYHRLSKPWDVDGDRLQVRMHMLALDIPGAIANISALKDVVVAMRFCPKSKPVFILKDLDLPGASRWIKLDRISYTCTKKEGMDVVYQPVWSVVQKKFVSAEALIRFRDPAIGSVRPDELVAVAESNGSIARLDALAREITLEFFQKHQDLIPSIHVNISMAECMQPKVVKSLIESVRKAGIDPSRFGLELTETLSAFMPAVVKENLRTLSSSGFHLYLDDFGVGQANMAQLMTTDFQVVKMDKGFMRSEKGSLWRESIIGMLKKLGYVVLVEGVETKEDAERVVAEGADLIQGYYYSKPLSEDDLVSLLQKQGTL